MGKSIIQNADAIFGVMVPCRAILGGLELIHRYQREILYILGRDQRLGQMELSSISVGGASIRRRVNIGLAWAQDSWVCTYCKQPLLREIAMLSDDGRDAVVVMVGQGEAKEIKL